MVSFLKMCPHSHLADRILLKSKKVSALQRPAESDWRSVMNWIYRSGTLTEGEQQFIKKKEDLITLRRGRECAGFDNLVERTLRAADRTFVWCGWKSNVIKASLPSGESVRSRLLTPRAADFRNQGASGEDLGRLRKILRPRPRGQAGQLDHHDHHLRPLGPSGLGSL